jgi:outer membrane protein TolC
VAEAKQSLVQAENAVALASAAFNNALGRDVSTPVSLLPIEAGKLRIPDPEASVQQALERRPEILSLEKSLRIGRENVKIQRAGRQPALNVGVNYRRQTTTGFSQDYSWDASLSLSLPVFDRGLAKAQVREAKELAGQTESQLEEARQGIMLEVKQSVLNVVEAKQRIETATKSVEAAEESMRIADLRYREGVGTQLEVTDARLALNRARTNYTQALYDYQTAYATWENAVGGGVPR